MFQKSRPKGSIVPPLNKPAAEELKDKASFEIIDIRTLSLLDEKTIVDSVKKSGRVRGAEDRGNRH
jgi:pyruvate/2-oxoglutarate/acetoin dehydrogenase E1 component